MQSKRDSTAMLKCSINQIEGIDWGKPLINTVTASEIHQARSVPIADLNPIQLYTLLLHDLGVRQILPIGISLLRHRPYLEAKFYPGDLLKVILLTKEPYWSADFVDDMKSILVMARKDIPEDLVESVISVMQTWEGPPSGSSLAPAEQWERWRLFCAGFNRDRNPGHVGRSTAKGKKKPIKQSQVVRKNNRGR